MQLEFPESLRELARGEGRPLDEEAIVRRLARARVERIEPYPVPGFGGVKMTIGNTLLSADNIWAASSSPVADAMDEAVVLAEKWDLLRRLHSALMDMDQVAHAARELAAAKKAVKEHAWSGGDADTDETRKLTQLAEVLETGAVTMYARHFTGNRRVPRAWEPRGKRRAAHIRLMERRHTVIAHADETGERELVNTNAMLGVPGKVLAEARRLMPRDDLLELAHHCERMYARYSDVVLQLKWDLGVAASGQILGPDEYDE